MLYTDMSAYNEKKSMRSSLTDSANNEKGPSASYPMGTGGSFPHGKAAGALS